MIEKLLIAVDDSPAAMHAADYGINLAKTLHAEVGVVCVAENGIGNIDAGLLPQDVEKTLQMRSDNLLDEINITHPELKIEEFDPIGNPYTEIQNVIELWKPDLLVIGHHNKNVFDRIFNRSTERALVNHINIPILIVPENR